MSLILARLSSPNDGERLAALLHATRMLKAEGLTWETALFGATINAKGYTKAPAVSEEFPDFIKPSTGMTVKEQLEYCLRRYKSASLSDRTILTALRPQVDRGKELSPRNYRLLAEMVHKFREADK